MLKLYPVKGQCDYKDCYRRAQQVLVAANGLFWYCNQHAETAISEVVG